MKKALASGSTMPRLVVCAAIRNKAGCVIIGIRHLDGLMRDQIKRAGGHASWQHADQGFVDNRGTFLTREEALEIAKSAGQIRRRCGGDEQRLYSENLY